MIYRRKNNNKLLFVVSKTFDVLDLGSYFVH